MGRERRVMRLNRVAQAAIVAGIVIAVNVIAQRWYARVDLTERREYSLAPSTRRVLAGLDDTVVVNGYFSRRLPPYLLGVRQQVQDLLEEYRARSGGKLTLEITDPGDDPAAVQRLRALGIPQLQLEVLERDRFQVTNAWLGIAVLHGGRQEVIPVIQDTATLEYDLTAALLRLTSPERKVVGWLGGDEEREEARGGGIRRELARLYEVRSLGGEELEEVPAEVATLVVDGPRDLPAAAVGALDRFVRRGGRAIFLVDRLEMPPGTLAARPVDSGLEGLLERYGAKVAADVVAEPHFNAPASFSTGFLQFRVPYPYWVRATGETLDREHPVTAKLENLVFPWTSSLEAVAPGDGTVRAEVLASSSPQAWVETGPYDFMPQPGRAPGRPRGPVGQRALAVLLTGRFPAPEGEAADGEGADSAVLVVGTSRVAAPDFLRQFPENAAFLLNAIDWMTMGPDLIGIRSRVAAERVIPDVGDRMRGFLKGLNVVGVPLLVALLGIVRLQVRRRRERSA